MRDQVIGLVDIANRCPPVVIHLFFLSMIQLLTINNDFTIKFTIQSANDVHQRRFAAPRFSKD